MSSLTTFTGVSVASATGSMSHSTYHSTFFAIETTTTRSREESGKFNVQDNGNGPRLLPTLNEQPVVEQKDLSWAFGVKPVERLSIDLQPTSLNTEPTKRSPRVRKTIPVKKPKDKRWNDSWQTQYETIYVTNTQQVPEYITVTQTYETGDNVINGGTLTRTLYEGLDTVTVPAPVYVTLTYYPTTTIVHEETRTIPTGTATVTAGQNGQGGQKNPPPEEEEGLICLPGDSGVMEKSGLAPTTEQTVSLYVTAIYLIALVIIWNLIGVRLLIYPLKWIVIMVHEAGHLACCILFQVKVYKISSDPTEGGAILCGHKLEDSPEPKEDDEEAKLTDSYEHRPTPLIVLPAGYLFSILFGGILVFCGFNTLASKIASFAIGFMLVPLFIHVQGIIKKVIVLSHIGLMIGLWFVDHARGLRFYILLIGVMSSFYVFWDVLDDILFCKKYPSCPVLFAQALEKETPIKLSASIITLVWVGISFIFFIGFLLAALAAWKQTPHAMYCQAQGFLPT